MNLCFKIKEIFGFSNREDRLFNELNKIGELINNMGIKQDEFDAQLAVITEKLESQDELLLDLQETVVTETGEIREVIAELRNMIEVGTVDISGLSVVVEKLDAHSAILEAASDSVDDMYEDQETLPLIEVDENGNI